MALGVRGSVIVRQALKRALLLAWSSIIPGVLVAFVSARAMQAVLFGVPPSDPVTFVIVVTLCLVMTLVGSLFPALYAVRIDPIRALKAE